MYGSIGKDFGTEDPVSTIPSGGLAYTNRGNYLCIFYGQTPAWPVEYIGNIIDDGFQAKFSSAQKKVIIKQNYNR